MGPVSVKAEATTSTYNASKCRGRVFTKELVSILTTRASEQPGCHHNGRAVIIFIKASFSHHAELSGHELMAMIIHTFGVGTF